jgi:phosphatidylglycerol:prolipoprotein diacylglycerol transferase
MFPEPFHIGPIRIALYGVMVALGLLAAIVLGGRENQRIKLMTPELFEKVALWTVLWGLITSRMFYVFTDFARFAAEPSSIFAIWEGGLVFYGGPIGSATYLAYHFVVRRHGPVPDSKVSVREGWVRLLRFFDLGAPMLAMAHAFGRLGCLAAGCCFGAPHEGMFALHYPDNSPAWLAEGGGRYPIPLAESGIEFLIFLWLMRLRMNKQFHGQVMLHYVILYPTARFVLEMFRGDAVRGYVAKLETPALNQMLGLDPSVPVLLTTSQFLSLVVAAVSIVLIIVGKKVAAGGPIEETPLPDPVVAEAEDDEEEDDEEAEAEEAAAPDEVAQAEQPAEPVDKA